MGIVKKQEEDFPGGTVDGNLPDNAGDTGSVPGPGRFYTQRNLSLITTTTKSQRAATTEPTCGNYRSLYT